MKISNPSPFSSLLPLHNVASYKEEVMGIKNLPLELIQSIFEYLRVTDVAQFLKVNKKWQNFVTSNPDFIHRIKAALVAIDLIDEAKQIAQAKSYGSLYLVRVAKVEALYNLTKAEQTAQTIKPVQDSSCKGNALLQIAKIKARHNLLNNFLILVEQAIQDLVHSYYKSNMLFSIIKIVALHNLDYALQTYAKAIKAPHFFTSRLKAFLTILKMQVQHGNLAQAKSKILSLYNPDYRNRALLEMVKIEIHQGLAEAKQTALTIDDPYYKALALLEIVKVDSGHNLNEAKQVALTIDDQYQKSKILIKLAKIDLEQNFDEAKDAILNISEDEYEDHKIFKLLVKLGKIDPEHDFTEAAKYGDTDLDGGFQIAFKVIKTQARYNETEARLTALQLMTCPQSQAKGLLKIAKVVPQYDFTEVKQLISKLNNETYKAELIAKMAKLDPQVSFAEAKQTAIDANGTDLANNTLQKIALLEARRDPALAKQTALQIRSADYRVQTLLRIAKIYLLKPSYANFLLKQTRTPQHS